MLPNPLATGYVVVGPDGRVRCGTLSENEGVTMKLGGLDRTKRGGYRVARVALVEITDEP